MNDVLGVLFDFGGTLFAHDPLAATIMSTSRRLGTEVTSQWAEALADRVQSAAHTADELRHPRDLDDRVWRQRWHVLYALADDEIPGLGAELYGAMHDPLQWQPYAATVATLQRVHATGVPIANGILTTEDDDQALSRMQVKGADCAQAAVEMARLLKALA